MPTTTDFPSQPSSNLTDLANEIRKEHEQAVRQSLPHAIRAGELLIGVKRTLKHGEWRDWLKLNRKILGFSERTAQLYMRLYRHRDELLTLENARRIADLTSAIDAITRKDPRKKLKRLLASIDRVLALIEVVRREGELREEVWEADDERVFEQIEEKARDLSSALSGLP